MKLPVLEFHINELSYVKIKFKNLRHTPLFVEPPKYVKEDIV